MVLKLTLAALVGAGAVAAAPHMGQYLPPQISALVDGASGGRNARPANSLNQNNARPQAITPAAGRVVPENRSSAIASYAPVVDAAAPAVVNVYARSIQQGRVAVDPFWGAFRIPDRASQSQGSGVIVRANGIIVTNNHVVEGATELVVVLGDRREFPAHVILTDERTDLAVLRIDVGNEALPFLSFADTSAAKVGDQVLAVGNPFGVGQTVTSGIISALARTDVGITDYSFFIQTDASINPGNSGGALVDMRGALVGVNTAIFSRSGSSSGVGFAIPAEMVRRVVDSALSNGRIVRAWTGVRGQTVDAEMARTLGMDRPGGVLVAEVWPGSPAANAGLRRGDVILSLDDDRVADAAALRYLAATKAPNATVRFGVRRRTESVTLSARLDQPPGEARPTGALIDARNSFGGTHIAAITPALAEERGIDPFIHGLVILSVDQGSFAERSGFHAADIILDVDGTTVRTVEELQGKFESGKQGEVTIQRGEQRITASLFL